jgi:phospholipid-translocating ATPase
MIYLEKGERVPCDLVVLATKSSDNGIVFIKTDQLDGETDWKERMSCSLIQKEYNSGMSIHDIGFSIEIGEPNNEIYKFRGIA